ncbi:hypothetical protein B0T11DRAFT_354023 [Plectosphaerella cucumerina]|uniref:Uncharacterized protein n=1 Tax=Plectosphaerella cucumerina TaxID=40658 RepID=A0A8K0TJF5_9PEZI|nr:hypothetical protein B0T11DRAFT_354023 [Plectosphaerella cucumerina]
MALRFDILPPELRAIIYKLLLVHDDIICIGGRRYCLHPLIMATGKQILQEARPILYSLNRFQFHQPALWTRQYVSEFEQMASFLDLIGIQNAALLRCVCITFPIFEPGHASCTLNLIKDRCSGIRGLHLMALNAVDDSIIQNTHKSLQLLPSLAMVKVEAKRGCFTDVQRERVQGWSWVEESIQYWNSADDEEDETGSMGLGLIEYYL